MQKRSTIFLSPVAILGVVILIAWGGLASAAGTRAGGRARIYEADSNLAGPKGKVILTGAITDHGTDHQGVPQDGTNRLDLSRGSFSIYVNNLGNKLASMPFDPTTCSSDGSKSAWLPIVPGSGTGAYEGITGGFHTTGATATILHRLPNGACDTNDTHYWGVLIAQGSGEIAYNK